MPICKIGKGVLLCCFNNGVSSESLTGLPSSAIVRLIAKQRRDGGTRGHRVL